MTSILAFVVVLGVLIFVHELGHFLTAKAAGIAVPRFSIGLGPRVWGFKAGETEYVISALPLGGYVKMAGMGEEEVLERLEGGASDSQTPPQRRFDNKPLATRAIVISAGVIMNFLFAIIAFAAIAYRQSWPPVIAEVEPGRPAEEAGLQPGDRILAVDGNEIELWLEFSLYVSERPGKTVALRLQRDGRQIEVESRIAYDTLILETEPYDTIVLGRIGVTRDTVNVRRALGPGAALATGTRRTAEMSGLIVAFVVDLVTGQASPRDLGGPILIGQYSGRAARAGFLQFVTFMAVLSVHLAVLNLLPIPVLDGGHLVFLLIEAVRGRALSIQARVRLSQFGFILILALMVWVLTSDVLRLTGN